VSLTKFRAGLAGGAAAPDPEPLEKEPPAPAAAPAAPAKPLGKLRLIRRLRGGGGAGGRKRHPILRLFGSF
jgi:hypothetical protein